jgi:NTP pyrophosphatase (non-canonical NTP hydrolase)
MILNAIGNRASKHCIRVGFWDGKSLPDVPEMLCLIHSEVSEALEEHRNGGKNIKVELADIIIRTCQLAYRLGIGLDGAVQEKMDYNDTRPHKHGGKLY